MIAPDPRLPSPLTASQIAQAQLGNNAFGRFLGEGLVMSGWGRQSPFRSRSLSTIGGRMVRRRNLYRRLARADVQIKST